jgi:hypothetical protein
MHSNIYKTSYVMRVSVWVGGRKGAFNWEFTIPMPQTILLREAFCMVMKEIHDFVFPMFLFEPNSVQSLIVRENQRFIFRHG